MHSAAVPLQSTRRESVFRRLVHTAADNHWAWPDYLFRVLYVANSIGHDFGIWAATPDYDFFYYHLNTRHKTQGGYDPHIEIDWRVVGKVISVNLSLLTYLPGPYVFGHCYY